MWSFKSDSGSAVVDFVIITIPASLVGLVLIGLFGLAQSTLVKESQAFELARRVAMADISDSDAASLRDAIYPTADIQKSTTSAGCQINVVADAVFYFLRYFEPLHFRIRQDAYCENSQ